MRTLVVLLVLAPTVSGAPYLQAGYDAARTGNTPDSGPETDDVAWMVRLPGSRAGTALPLAFESGSPPLIIGRDVYVLTADQQIPGLGVDGVFRVGLDDARVEAILSFEGPPKSMASDGERLLVATSTSVDAYPLSGGIDQWSWPYEPLVDGHLGWHCVEPAVGNATVYVACTDVGAVFTPALVAGGVGVSCVLTSFVAALDVATGAEQWVWVDRSERAGAVPVDVLDPADARTHRSLVLGLSVIGPYVIANTYDVDLVDPCPTLLTGGVPLAQAVVHGLDAATGTPIWSLSAEPPCPRQGPPPSCQRQLPLLPSIFPTGNAQVGFVRMDRDLIAFNPAHGSELWRENVSRGDVDAPGAGSAFALVGRDLFATSSQHIYLFALDGPPARWDRGLDPASHEGWATAGLLVANGTIYARSGGNGTREANVAYAFRAEDGVPRWRLVLPYSAPAHPLSARDFEFAVGEGVLVAAGIDGTVWVIGRTGASPILSALASSAYPAPGSHVSVAVSGIRAGALGPVTAFRADWGDGTVTNWQTSPALEHAYERAGDVTARFQARNDANQTASVLLTFHVGATEPVRPTLLERAFTRDNQDLTFGVLGLALAVGGGLFAVAHRRTRRRRLQGELDAVERTFATTRDRPFDCETALAQRRVSVRGLGLEGKLDQAEVLLLERRIDELLQQLRLEGFEAQFPFLSVGMARTLRDMLADGRIVAWEREHFVEALERDEHLTADQKSRVKAQIEAWFARDARA